MPVSSPEVFPAPDAGTPGWTRAGETLPDAGGAALSNAGVIVLSNAGGRGPAGPGAAALAGLAIPGQAWV